MLTQTTPPAACDAFHVIGTRQTDCQTCFRKAQHVVLMHFACAVPFVLVEMIRLPVGKMYLQSPMGQHR